MVEESLFSSYCLFVVKKECNFRDNTYKVPVSKVYSLAKPNIRRCYASSNLHWFQSSCQLAALLGAGHRRTVGKN